MTTPTQILVFSKNSLENQDQIIRFGRGMGGNDHLMSGWGEPEAGFVWSEGKFCSLSLPASPGLNIFKFTVWGYVAGSTAAQEVMVYANGILKGYYEVKDLCLINLNHDNITGSDQVEFNFYIPTATSPQVMEGSDDQRRLGLAISVIQCA
jgi:hypothetical protein